MNTKNLKALTDNELKFLNQNYVLSLSEDKTKILLNYTNFPSKVAEWSIEGSTSLAFSYEDKFTKRKRLMITEKAKKMYVEKNGKWNLFYIQNLLSTFLLNKKDIDKLSSEEIERAYIEIDFRQFIRKG